MSQVSAVETSLASANENPSLMNDPLKRDAVVIALVGLAHGISHFFQMLLAPLFPWLKLAFDLSYAQLGFLMTVFFVVSGIGQALAGFIVDKIGARVVLMFGVGSLALSALILAGAQNYSMLLLGSVIAGLGNSIFHPADYTILNRSVSTPRLAYAFSIHGISGNLGWASAAVFLVGIASVSNWRIAILAAAALPVIVLLIFFYYRNVLRAQSPAQLDVLAKEDKLDAQESKDSAQNTEGMFAFMKLKSVWMCFAFFCMISMALGGIHGFSALSLNSLYGMSLAWASSAYTAYMLASAGGMLWGAYLSARATSHDATITKAFSVAGVCSLILATGVPHVFVAFALMGLIGFCAGVAGPSRDLLIRAAAPKNATGRVYGVVYSGLDIGLAVSPLIFGRLMDAHHPSWIFIFVGIFQSLAIFTAMTVGKQSRANGA